MRRTQKVEGMDYSSVLVETADYYEKMHREDRTWDSRGLSSIRLITSLEMKCQVLSSSS